MQRVTSGEIGAVDLGTVTGEAEAMENRSLEKQVLVDKPVLEGTPDRKILVTEHQGSPWSDETLQEPPITTQEQETVRRRGNTAEYDIDPTLNWLLMRAGDEWGPLGVAKAAAFLAGHHVKPGFAPRDQQSQDPHA